MLIRYSVNTLKAALKALAYSLSGSFVVLLAVFIWHLESRPDLKIWHLADLDAEFTADSPVHNFSDYLALEDRLFGQLNERVYKHIETVDQTQVNRYHRDSLSDPERWQPNWNRSFELPVDTPKAGVLLLHGLSDSPYSLRNLSQRLHREGAWVLGLRIPGHGTAPSGLVEVRWQDMAAAVRLAMRHLRDQISGQPLYIVGYSNGGALAVHYALTALEDTALPEVSRLVLISPAIGVTTVAALAVWQARLGHLLGLEKLAWNSILPEYDPFKYGSFAINAGDLTHRFTDEIQRRLTALTDNGELKRFPPLLAFQSVVDATVSTPALVKNLFARLPGDNHELVLFDINRLSGIEPLISASSKKAIESLFENQTLPFDISLVSNENTHSQQVVALHKKAGENAFSETALDLSWPPGLYSLTHVALPFPADDPLYGSKPTKSSPGIRLGNLAMHGERDILRISAADMLRLRWNPFFPYLERRLLDFIGLNAASQ